MGKFKFAGGLFLSGFVWSLVAKALLHMTSDASVLLNQGIYFLMLLALGVTFIFLQQKYSSGSSCWRAALILFLGVLIPNLDNVFWWDAMLLRYNLATVWPALVTLILGCAFMSVHPKSKPYVAVASVVVIAVCCFWGLNLYVANVCATM